MFFFFLCNTIATVFAFPRLQSKQCINTTAKNRTRSLRGPNLIFFFFFFLFAFLVDDGIEDPNTTIKVQVSLTLQEIRSIHDSMNIPNIEFSATR